MSDAKNTVVFATSLGEPPLFKGIEYWFSIIFFSVLNLFFIMGLLTTFDVIFQTTTIRLLILEPYEINHTLYAYMFSIVLNLLLLKKSKFDSITKNNSNIKQSYCFKYRKYLFFTYIILTWGFFMFSLFLVGEIRINHIRAGHIPNAILRTK